MPYKLVVGVHDQVVAMATTQIIATNFPRTVKYLNVIFDILCFSMNNFQVDIQNSKKVSSEMCACVVPVCDLSVQVNW